MDDQLTPTFAVQNLPGGSQGLRLSLKATTHPLSIRALNNPTISLGGKHPDLCSALFLPLLRLPLVLNQVFENLEGDGGDRSIDISMSKESGDRDQGAEAEDHLGDPRTNRQRSDRRRSSDSASRPGDRPPEIPYLSPGDSHL